MPMARSMVVPLPDDRRFLELAAELKIELSQAIGSALLILSYVVRSSDDDMAVAMPPSRLDAFGATVGIGEAMVTAGLLDFDGVAVSLPSDLRSQHAALAKLTDDKRAANRTRQRSARARKSATQEQASAIVPVTTATATATPARATPITRRLGTVKGFPVMVLVNRKGQPFFKVENAEPPLTGTVSTDEPTLKDALLALIDKRNQDSRGLLTTPSTPSLNDLMEELRALTEREKTATAAMSQRCHSIVAPMSQHCHSDVTRLSQNLPGKNALKPLETKDLRSEPVTALSQRCHTEVRVSPPTSSSNCFASKKAEKTTTTSGGVPPPSEQEEVISSLLARFESERQDEIRQAVASTVSDEKKQFSESLAAVLGKSSCDVLRLMDSAPGELALQLKGAACGGERARARLEELGIDPATGRPVKRTPDAPGGEPDSSHLPGRVAAAAATEKPSDGKAARDVAPLLPAPIDDDDDELTRRDRLLRTFSDAAYDECTQVQ